MVEISLYGSGEGPGWVTAPGYSTAGFLRSDNARSGNSQGGSQATRTVGAPVGGTRGPWPR